MSQTRKTWDGLRVWKGVWYPRHPQLDIRAIPDHMAVPDARPRTVDTYAPCYGLGAFCLRSLGSICYIYYVVDDGALMVVAGTLPIVVDSFTLDTATFTAADDGALLVIQTGSACGGYLMITCSGIEYSLWVEADGAVKIVDA